MRLEWPFSPSRRCEEGTIMTRSLTPEEKEERELDRGDDCLESEPSPMKWQHFASNKNISLDLLLYQFIV